MALSDALDLLADLEEAQDSEERANLSGDIQNSIDQAETAMDELQEVLNKRELETSKAIAEIEGREGVDEEMEQETVLDEVSEEDSDDQGPQEEDFDSVDQGLQEEDFDSDDQGPQGPQEEDFDSDDQGPQEQPLVPNDYDAVLKILRQQFESKVDEYINNVNCKPGLCDNQIWSAQKNVTIATQRVNDLRKEQDPQTRLDIRQEIEQAIQSTEEAIDELESILGRRRPSENQPQRNVRVKTGGKEDFAYDVFGGPEEEAFEEQNVLSTRATTPKRGSQSTAVALTPELGKRTALRPPKGRPGPKRINRDAANFFMDLTRDTPEVVDLTEDTPEVIDLTKDTSRRGRQSTAVALTPVLGKRTALRPPKGTPGRKRVNTDAANFFMDLTEDTPTRGAVALTPVLGKRTALRPPRGIPRSKRLNTDTAAAYIDLTDPFPDEGTRQSDPMDLTAAEVIDLTADAVATEVSPTAFTGAINDEIIHSDSVRRRLGLRERNRLGATPGYNAERLGYATSQRQEGNVQGVQTRSRVKRGGRLPFGKNSRALNIALIRGEMAAGNTNPMLKKGLKKLLAGRGARIPSNTSQRIRFV